MTQVRSNIQNEDILYKSTKHSETPPIIPPSKLDISNPTDKLDGSMDEKE